MANKIKGKRKEKKGTKNKKQNQKKKKKKKKEEREGRKETIKQHRGPGSCKENVDSSPRQTL